jgi:hypothetical protein
MDILPVKVLLLGAIPEAILIIWAGLSLLGIRPSWRKLVFAGILQGLTAYFIRRYTDFGVHTVIQFVTIVTYMCILIRVNLPTALIATLASYSVVIITEGCAYIFFDVNIAHVLSDEWLRILLFIPHNVILALIGYICTKKKISLQQEFTVLNKIVK